MKLIKQFIYIIAFTFIGELLHFLIPLPIPASIYGIVLLFIALMKKWVKVSDIRETSTFLIAIMPVMFIPAAVGLIDSLAGCTIQLPQVCHRNRSEYFCRNGCCWLHNAAYYTQKQEDKEHNKLTLMVGESRFAKPK